MTRSETDQMIRICHPCAITWKGSAPCWCCGADGTRAGEALAAHYTTAGAGHWAPSVRTPSATVPYMRCDNEVVLARPPFDMEDAPW